MDGFGSEASLTAILLLGLKVLRDFLKERREKEYAVKVVHSNGSSNPGKGTSSTNLVLYVLDEHGKQLQGLNENIVGINRELTSVQVNLAKINTKLEIKGGT